MSNREFGVSALGRFLAVERYRETCPYPSTNQVARHDLDRAGSHRDPTETSGGPRAATEIPASRYARQPTVLRS
jgi:hypothetical protein